jgi:hypothetical protein
MDIKKTTKVKLLSAVLVAAALAPLVSFAALGVNLKAVANVSGGSNFCTNLPTFSTNLNTKLTTAENNLTTKQQSIVTEAQTRETTRATALAATRAAADQNRAAIYVKLNTQATTSTEKDAVATFQTTIEADVAARRALVDTAISTYWSGVMSVLSTRQAAVQTAEQNYATAMQAALSAATTSCAASTTPATVRTTFAAAVKAATTQFATDRKAIDKSGPQIKALGQARNTSVASAFATFDAQAKAAGVTLKAAFTVTVSPTPVATTTP